MPSALRGEETGEEDRLAGDDCTCTEISRCLTWRKADRHKEGAEAPGFRPASGFLVVPSEDSVFVRKSSSSVLVTKACARISKGIVTLLYVKEKRFPLRSDLPFLPLLFRCP